MANLATYPETTSIPQPRTGLAPAGVPRAVPLEQFDCFIGRSAHVAELKQFISVQASQHQPVLLIGETGLRQEQIARALHQASEHWRQPFLAVNAHGLSTEALHNLLFGPRGVVETCQGGTIYVNELTRLSPLVQQRFAAHIEEQRWRERSGKPSSQRLIFATEWNPGGLNAENRIAYGLVEWLRASTFFLKPLRERSEDIPYLAGHLVKSIARRLGKGPHQIAPEAMKLLAEYEWKNNIDELEGVLESAISSTPPQVIDDELLPARIRNVALRAIPPAGIDLPAMLDQFERALIDTALRQTKGNQTRAARLLGLRVQTLNMKLKRFAEQQKEKQNSGDGIAKDGRGDKS
jgi:DNA-binding NtrC family response regulator